MSCNCKCTLYCFQCKSCLTNKTIYRVWCNECDTVASFDGDEVVEDIFDEYFNTVCPDELELYLCSNACFVAFGLTGNCYCSYTDYSKQEDIKHYNVSLKEKK